MPAFLGMIVIWGVYCILLLLIMGVIIGDRKGAKRIEKRVIEGTIIIQLLIISQWGIMGGEGIDSIEGFR